jgi:hypothetical protein
MKLKNLAALLFRIFGAGFILDGFANTVLALAEYDYHGFPPIAEFIFSGIIGYLCIIYSKPIASLFCKGLDDDSA